MRHGRTPDARLRQLFLRVSTAIAVTDADGRLRDANPAFCEILGRSLEELYDAELVTLAHDGDRAELAELIAQIVTGGKPAASTEHRFVNAAGRTVWVRSDLVLLEDDTGRHLAVSTENISPQKSVEARLEESVTLLRIAGDIARVGGWAIEADPVRLYWSDQVHDLAGYPRGRTPPLQEAFELYPPAARDRMGAAVEACLAHGVPFDLEVPFSSAQGVGRWVRVVGEPRRRPDGTVERIQGAILDITEQKQAQLQQELLARRLSTTMESITDALYTVDTDWRFTYVNARAQEVLERDARDLVGRRLWDEFPAAIGSPLETALRAADEHRHTMSIDEYHYGPLGRWFSVTVYPSEQGLAVYFQDVTDQRRNRVELEARGAQLAEQAALLDAAQDAIVVRDLDGRVGYWNRGAERIYGFTADEAQGRPVCELLGLDGVVHERALEELHRSGHFFDELVQTAKDGTELTVQARWTLLRDEEGVPVSVLGIETDVTDRKRMEQQFLRAQRMESIGHLAGGIAHDLNNALAPILMGVALLSQDEDDPQRQHLLQMMAGSAEHGAQMVRQVLSFARGVDGRREAVAVDDVLERVRRICVDTFPKSITVTAEVAEDLLPVVGDPTQIQQVLVNLCVNARDAMPEGGELTLRAHNGGSVPANGPAVVLQVTDTGSGIPPEVVTKMFDPFFSTKPQGEGTGLGLSTSAVIVDSHGGDIEVESEEGLGTTFTIRLPAEEADTAGGEATTGAALPGSGELVLVVDDEHALREVGRRVLEGSGYRALTAADGREALEAYRAHRSRVAAVVTDLMMPVMDGYALIGELRKLDRELPVVANSGLSAPEAVDRAYAAGADRFLAKPYTPVSLLEVLRDLLATADEAR
ncbi:PAS domain-containing hybrid sensor histidine kinase/response regulator [Egicoccus halophilus]|uniref:histidine kinase n=1 Tax=Egicoccus halophilus TaxID=1670830 RepID=A0A8J3AA41_9ACTN|nr:PAS domain S-box protein [Egicoccus halophilus]GGI08212.1 hypothetical protein GCM10011354_27960 [Egicoccus halophilus]